MIAYRVTFATRPRYCAALEDHRVFRQFFYPRVGVPVEFEFSNPFRWL